MKQYHFFVIIISFFFITTMFSCKKDNLVIDISNISAGCKIDFVKGNTKFSDKLSLLLNDSKKLTYEVGYILYPSSSHLFIYEKIEGKPDEASIIFSPKKQIAGFIHSHYSNLYPIFSGSDIKSIYEAYNEEKINDYSKFFIAVVSSFESSYLLKITDLNLFIAFSKKNLIDKNNFIDFENRYYNLQQSLQASIGIKSSFESALLYLLQNSGLTLYKSDFPFNNWNMLDLINNKLEYIRCL